MNADHTEVWRAAIQQKAERIMRSLNRHRERYLRAWVAATGIDPRDAILVERHYPDGTITISVERKP